MDFRGWFEVFRWYMFFLYLENGRFILFLNNSEINLKIDYYKVIKKILIDFKKWKLYRLYFLVVIVIKLESNNKKFILICLFIFLNKRGN